VFAVRHTAQQRQRMPVRSCRFFTVDT
jgi:hypothetical protein